MGQRLLIACFLFAAVTGASVFTPAVFAADITPQSRIAILQAVMAEYGTLQAPLPRGEKGLRLLAAGDIDRDNLTKELTRNGTALKTSTVVQITQIQFKNREIVLEINGGGKKKTKWYERIEVGMGSQTRPINDPNAVATAAAGSMITLVFPGRVPDMTPEELKGYLLPVLDLDATVPILGLQEAIPPEFQKAIEEHRAEVGMSQNMVLAALGPPERKVREAKNGVEQEDWIYGSPPLKVFFVVFEGDEVVDVQEHQGGVRGEVHPYPTQPPR